MKLDELYNKPPRKFMEILNKAFKDGAVDWKNYRLIIKKYCELKDIKLGGQNDTGGKERDQWQVYKDE